MSTFSTRSRTLSWRGITEQSPCMKRRNRPFEQARDSLLTLLASGVESVHRARSKFDQPDDPSRSKSAPQGDFLMDFTRLHLEYLNQLAKLGSNYSLVAASALERLYERYVPTEEPDQPGVQLLEGTTHDLVIVCIAVENDTDYSAEFVIDCSGDFAVDRDHKVSLAVQFQHPKRRRGSRIRFELDEGERVEVRVGVTLTDAMVRGVDYHGVIAVARRAVIDKLTKEEHCPEERWLHPLLARRVGS